MTSRGKWWARTTFLALQLLSAIFIFVGLQLPQFVPAKKDNYHTYYVVSTGSWGPATSPNEGGRGNDGGTALTDFDASSALVEEDERLRPTYNASERRNVCVTLFAVFPNCEDKSHRERHEDVWAECVGRVSRLRHARNAAIATSVFSSIAVIVAAVRLFGIPYVKLVSSLLVLLCLGLGCASWAAVADVYSRRIVADSSKYGRTCRRMHMYEGEVGELPFGMQYGPGFMLLVTGWCFEVVAYIALIVL